MKDIILSEMKPNIRKSYRVRIGCDILIFGDKYIFGKLIALFFCKYTQQLFLVNLLGYAESSTLITFMLEIRGRRFTIKIGWTYVHLRYDIFLEILEGKC